MDMAGKENEHDDMWVRSCYSLIGSAIRLKGLLFQIACSDIATIDNLLVPLF